MHVSRPIVAIGAKVDALRESRIPLSDTPRESPQLDITSACRYRHSLVLQWCRARTSAVAPVLMLSLAVLAWPHFGDSHHDPDGEFAPVFAHDPEGHSIGGSSSDQEPPRHCAICHAARFFRPITHVSFLSSSCAETVGFICSDVFTAAKGDISSQPPLRAPPTSPTSA